MTRRLITEAVSFRAHRCENLKCCARNVDYKIPNSVAYIYIYIYIYKFLIFIILYNETTTAQLLYSYMFRHYRVFLRETVISNLPSYASISNAAFGNTIYN